MAQIRGKLYQTLNIPTPRKLMNTAASPQAIGPDYARLLIDMVPSANKSNELQVRFGSNLTGDAIGAGTIIQLFEFRKSDGTLQILAYTNDGKLHSLDEGTGTWTEEKSGLNTSGVPGSVDFNEKLIIFNGLDTPFSWDGTTATDLGEFVSDELASNYTQVDTNTITIEPGLDANTGVNAEDANYPVGRQVRITFATAGAVTATVSASSYSDPTLTIDVSGTPFPSPSETITKVEYFDNPPAFQFMMAAHDRLWATAPGELKTDNTFRSSDPMRVYYTDVTNSENAWFNQETQEVGSINLQNKQGVEDDLVRISQIESFLIFHGRNKMQVWSGFTPGLGGDFSWVKTIPVGTVHPYIGVDFPADMVFAAPYGIRSLRNVFQTENLEIQSNIGEDIDPSMQVSIDTLLSSDTNYKTAKSTYYARDGFYVLKVANEVWVYHITEKARGWTLFGGLLGDCTAFLGLSDGRFIYAKDDQVYVYANGADGSAKGYKDNITSSTSQKIIGRWYSGWAEITRRWANKIWEFILGQGTSADYTFRRYKDDIIGESKDITGTFTARASLWGDMQWGQDVWGTTAQRQQIRDQFLATSIAIGLEFETEDNPASIAGIIAYGDT